VKMGKGFVYCSEWLQSGAESQFFLSYESVTSLGSTFHILQARKLHPNCRTYTSPPGGTTSNEVCFPFTKSKSFYE
jgi:hypothetical protein